MRSGLDEAQVTLPPPHRQDAIDYECPRAPSTVRRIRQVTPTGQLRVVMTSLLDTSLYPATDFSALYHSCWRIGEAFKRTKHRLNLEHTSGLSWLAACQDVAARMVGDNLNALASCLAAEERLAGNSQWRVNRTLDFNNVRRLLPRVLAGVQKITTRVTREIFSEIVKNLEKFIPDQCRTRPNQWKPHLSHAYKSAV